MLWAAVLTPFVRSGPLKAGLSRKKKIGRIGMQRLGDQTFTNYGTVGVGGVDEIDAQLDRASQDCDCLGMIGRFSPDAIAGELHCTEPEPANRNITNYKCSAHFGRAVGRSHCCTHIYRSLKRRVLFLTKPGAALGFIDLTSNQARCAMSFCASNTLCGSRSGRGTRGDKCSSVHFDSTQQVV